ncbi:MAG TPA: YqaJ viral recombinase family protein [Syntrophales bacterium]|nr:YqaJ viral recombinase family protein [Syntrophales bacterium]
MPITETQREARRKHLGSSDVAAILGVDPFKNAYDVWLEKTGKVDSSDISSEAAEIGNALETGILNLAERRLGKILRNQYRSAKDSGKVLHRLHKLFSEPGDLRSRPRSKLAKQITTN